MTIDAVDYDDDTLEYRSFPNSNDPMDGFDKFRIDPSTGMITLKAPIDREQIPVYHLNIEVSDGQNVGKDKGVILCYFVMNNVEEMLKMKLFHHI